MKIGRIACVAVVVSGIGSTGIAIAQIRQKAFGRTAAATLDDGRGGPKTQMELLRPYYVIERKGEHICVSRNADLGSCSAGDRLTSGWVNAQFVELWGLREGLLPLRPIGRGTGLVGIQGFLDKEDLRAHQNSKDGPLPEFIEPATEITGKSPILRAYPVVSKDATIGAGAFEVLVPVHIEQARAVPITQGIEKKVSLDIAVVLDCSNRNVQLKKIRDNLKQYFWGFSRQPHVKDVSLGTVCYHGPGGGDEVITHAEILPLAVGISSMDTVASKVYGTPRNNRLPVLDGVLRAISDQMKWRPESVKIVLLQMSGPGEPTATTGQDWQAVGSQASRDLAATDIIGLMTESGADFTFETVRKQMVDITSASGSTGLFLGDKASSDPTQRALVWKAMNTFLEEYGSKPIDSLPDDAGERFAEGGVRVVVLDKQKIERLTPAARTAVSRLIERAAGSRYVVTRAWLVRPPSMTEAVLVTNAEVTMFLDACDRYASNPTTGTWEAALERTVTLITGVEVQPDKKRPPRLLASDLKKVAKFDYSSVYAMLLGDHEAEGWRLVKAKEAITAWSRATAGELLDREGFAWMPIQAFEGEVPK